MPEISIIVPLYNEEAVISRTIDTLIAVVEPAVSTFEIVLVDDGSRDRSAEIVAARSAADGRVRLVRFSRNFGKEAALAAGLDAAQGEAIITIDADLQHPPQLIPQMIERWRAGYDVVEAVKVDRGSESRVYGLAAQLFYVLMGRALGRNVRGDSDYKLLDRAVVDVLKSLPERHRYYRGLVVWAGFRVMQLPVEIQERAAGTTKWSLIGLLRYSFRNMVEFTSLPLQVIAWVGFLSVIGGLLLGVQTLYNWATGAAVSGFTTVILLTILMSGVILICLGVVAIYLAFVYEEIKGRPVYVVMQTPPRARVPRPADSAQPDQLIR